MEFNCALEGKEIRRKYKKFVLDVPELRVPKGYATALVGENGAGKTTLLDKLHILENTMKKIGKTDRKSKKKLGIPARRDIIFLIGS